MGSLIICLQLDCNGMGDAANVSPCIPSTCMQSAILSVLNIHITPSRQLYVAINNFLLILSVACLTASIYSWNNMGAADDVSHAENLQSSHNWFISHLETFRD